MGNLYYEQLERECDPELLHLHLSKYEATLLSIALSSWDSPGAYDIKRQIDKFLHEKGILRSGD